MENSWAQSREEADAFRALTTGSLGEFLDFHRDLKTDEERVIRGHAEKVAAMEMEIGQIRKMLKDAIVRLDKAGVELTTQRQLVREGETKVSGHRPAYLTLERPWRRARRQGRFRTQG